MRSAHEMASSCPVTVRRISLCDACATCQGVPESGQRRLIPGELLFHQGDHGDPLHMLIHMVVSGSMMETATLPDGRTIGLRLVEPGGVVGTDALLGQAYSTSVEALTTVRVCGVSAREAWQHLGRSIESSEAMIRALAEDLGSVRQHLVLIGSMTAEERVTSALRYLTRRAMPGAWTRLPLTRGEFATFLGLAQATVSRIVQRLARREVLDVHGRHVRFTRS